MNGCFVHESSYVDEGAELGSGTKIWHYCHVMAGATIGRNCILGQNVFIGEAVRVGHDVKIQNNVSLYTGVVIEDGAFIGPSAVFTNIRNPRSGVPRKHEFQRTLVRRGASVGANATVVCGVTLGCYAFIGAGAVITRDVPDYALVYGNPARLQGWMCQCGVKLDFEAGQSLEGRARCGSCGAVYVKRGSLVRPLETV